MNVNTRPANQKQAMKSSGWATCTCRNSRLPSPMSVVCASDSTAMTPKRPRNSSRGFGSCRASRVRADTVGFKATRMSSDPMNSASVV